MNRSELESIARAMVAKGKGILAADESGGTIKKRFDGIKLDSTEEARRTYREMLFTTPGAAEYISGVILYDETIRQKTKDGTPFPQYLAKLGIVPGIKVDTGAKALAAFPSETITEGLDGLRERLAEYHKLGARFAKWRAVIDIGAGFPTQFAIDANAHALARYAALCQEANIVPIVEPEVLMDGGHSIERCEEVTSATLASVFEQLHSHRIHLEGMILKPNMVISGKKAATRANPQQVAEATVRTSAALCPGRGARHRIPVGRTELGGGDRAPEPDEQARPAAVAAELLVWPRVAGRGAEGVGRQARDVRCRPEGVLPPRQVQRPGAQRQLQLETGTGSGLTPRSALTGRSDH